MEAGRCYPVVEGHHLAPGDVPGDEEPLPALARPEAAAPHRHRPRLVRVRHQRLRPHAGLRAAAVAHPRRGRGHEDGPARHLGRGYY